MQCIKLRRMLGGQEKRVNHVPLSSLWRVKRSGYNAINLLTPNAYITELKPSIPVTERQKV